MGEDPVEANRRLWNARTPIHVRSEFYDVGSFVAGRDSLHAIEVAEVGDVAGRSLLHLQCHFGQDTISWARRGAKVTGLDFSGVAVAEATQLAQRCGVEARFVEANVYDAVEALDGEQFEVVFTSYGVLAWLPDIPRWAEVVSTLVAPGGFLYLVELHPFSQAFADDPGVEDLHVGYPYFESAEPIRFEEEGTYADPWADIKMAEYYWAHSIGEIVTALVDAGLVIDFLHEHPMTVYQQFPFFERGDDGWWRPPASIPSVPLLFSLQGHRDRLTPMPTRSPSS